MGGGVIWLFLCAPMLVISGRKMNIDLPGMLQDDDENAGFVSSSDDNLFEHDLLDLGKALHCSRTVQMTSVTTTVMMNVRLMKITATCSNQPRTTETRKSAIEPIKKVRPRNRNDREKYFILKRWHEEPPWSVKD